MLPRLGRLVAAAACLALGVSAPPAAAQAPADSVLWAIGDANASSLAAETARRVTGPIDRFLYLGDVYENGTASEFRNNFDTVWGKWKPITLPTPGNHEWGNRATGYDPYWGPLARKTNGGYYYSVDQNGWEIISLNSEESMRSGSAQHSWLKSRLASGGNCRVVIMHRPRYSAGDHGDNPSTQPLWDLMAGKVRLVLTGHDHNMQRTKPINGITELISGAAMRITDANNADSRMAFINDRERGILRLTLSTVGSGGATASHRFVATDDGATLDSGSVNCTPAAGSTPTPTPTPSPGPTPAYPSAPLNHRLQATGDGWVEHAWNAVPGAAGYTVAITRPGQATRYTATTALSHRHTGLANGQAVDVDVRAVSRPDDGRGAWSGRRSATPAASTPTPTTRTFAAVADAPADESTRTTNHAGRDLRTDGGGDADVESYLRFSPTGLTGTVRSAKLRLRAHTGTANGPAVYPSGAAWTETGLTWSNRPGRLGAARDDKGAIAAGTWVEWDVTPLVSRSGDVNLSLATTSSDGVDFYSREDALAPQLVVTTE